MIVTKKNLISGIILTALTISITTNVILLINFPQQSTPRDPLTLVVGTYSGPYTLEIIDCRDSGSRDVLYQVVETLFTLDFYDPNLPRVNLLAKSYWWENSTTLHIKLREGIIFHDGTPFNASAAKWNFDRLQYLTNATGTNNGEVAYDREPWMLPDGKTSIIKNVAVVGTYNLTFTLNGAYGPFLSTLSYINAGMLSPTAHAVDTENLLDLDDIPVVTVLFLYVYYTLER
jgi:peptide/nickel transport system substrate-binding protein